MQALAIALQAFAPGAFAKAPEEHACAAHMQTWVEQQTKRFPADRPQDPRKMLYFLHVPRTAGRTTHNCFLMPMTPPSRRCAKSYDGIKYNISVPDCGLLSSHDDHSAMLQLPDFAAIYTSIRNPVSRVLSAYEFAVEIASREAVKVIDRKAPDPAQGRVATKNVWPWSYLAPFVEDDMVVRSGAATNVQFENLKEDRRHGRWIAYRTQQNHVAYFNRLLNLTAYDLTAEQRPYLLTQPLPRLDPYNNELYMPLLEYVGHSAAAELLHNGQTLQVLGLTNYSMDPEASELRHCIMRDRKTAEIALDFAKERLRGMWHVGTYETLRPSLTSLAASLGSDVGGVAYKTNNAHAFSYDGGTADGEIAWRRVQSFLDAGLPQTEDEIKAEMQKTNQAIRTTSTKLTQLKQARFRRGAEVEPPEEAAVRIALAEHEALRSKLMLQVTNLRAGTKVISRLEATGRARQLMPDEEHQLNRTVAENFGACEANSQKKARRKHHTTMAKVRRADGASPRFGAASRKLLAPETVKLIEEANWMDMELHKLAVDLNQGAIDRENKRTGGLLELPKHQDLIQLQQREQAYAEAAQRQAVAEQAVQGARAQPAAQPAVPAAAAAQVPKAHDEL